MNLYLFVYVEPTEKLPAQWQGGGSRVLAGGGFPACEFCEGPWTAEQQALVEEIVGEWHSDPPGGVTEKHAARRTIITQMARRGDFSFVLEFHTHEGERGPVTQDAERLYDRLNARCPAQGMTVWYYISL